MIKEGKQKKRKNKFVKMNSQLVIIGGGLSGTCAAITAARAGTKVVLVQDRPVLGGNASSEVRLWILGATSHLGSNNRWSREGGVIDEILVENLYRNKEGNPLILDTILLEKVINEPNIKLLLNTAVYEVSKKDDDFIESVTGFCSQNSTEYQIFAPLFCDASGDGIVSFLSGASFRMGAETEEEFEEKLAPDKSYGNLLGDSLYFYSKRVDKSVKFIPPQYALQGEEIEKLPRYHTFNLQDDGCRLWWIEYGGRRDTVHDSEEIKWELWKVVYGIWDHIKNSGRFDNVDNLTLEWVGTIPGKRESRRFEGEYMLKQDDLINQQFFDDAVAHGGWALDLHPADGVYSELPGANQWHSKGIYQIPFRCYISKDIPNLFFAGRIISASHVAFSSTRVMATCALGSQAVGMAAYLCLKYNLLPNELYTKNRIKELQDELNKNGQSVPGLPIIYQKNSIMDQVSIEVSSTYKLDVIPFNGEWFRLEIGAAQLLPMKKGTAYGFEVNLRAYKETDLYVELRVSQKKYNYTPDITLQTKKITLQKGEEKIKISFSETIPDNQYGFILFRANKEVEIQQSRMRCTGIVSVFNGKNEAVSNIGFQNPPKKSGVESFELWCPQRRPYGYNLAMKISPSLEPYDPELLKNGYTRPYLQANAWAADIDDKDPEVTLSWENRKTISSITLYFDTDFDHPLESTLRGHPEEVIPFCVREYSIFDNKDQLIYKVEKNHQTINEIKLEKPIKTETLKFKFARTDQFIPISLFHIMIQ